MYRLLSTVSYIIRFWLAYITIEKIPIFKNEIINYFWSEVISVYIIIMLISYFITGKLYSKNDMSSSVGVILYFFVYCILLFLYWLILLFLTWTGVLPIAV